MNSKERVIATLKFQKTDRVPFDLMEGFVWPELMDYFRAERGLQTPKAVLNFLQTDFRWVWMDNTGYGAAESKANEPEEKDKVFSGSFAQGPLSGAQTVHDVEAHKWPDPALWVPPDFAVARKAHPDHALVLCPGWMPLFWSACDAFGMEEALVKIYTQEDVFEAFVARQHNMYMDILKRGVDAARGHADICWLGDDYASQKQLMFSPEHWRKLIKPYLAKQVAYARKNGLYVIFHSCGNVRSILPDFIDIGINALLVFQTAADEMDAESIAREFGGKLAFYGGMDVQHLLSFGTVEDVQKTVRSNIKAFEKCGGYIVANSHHGVSTIKGQNIEAMCEAARMSQPVRI